MTRSSTPDWAAAVQGIRDANRRLRAGGNQVFDDFQDLVNRLFCLTIGHKHAAIHLRYLKDSKRRVAELEGGYGLGSPVVRLTNDYYLRLVVALYLDGQDEHLRTSISDFQYQTDEDGKEWVFRYEYKRERDAGERKPSAHLHLRSTVLARGVLHSKRPLHKVHFPCGRPTIESTIRLLIDDFSVPSDAPERVWRPALAESEQSFMAVAHAPGVF